MDTAALGGYVLRDKRLEDRALKSKITNLLLILEELAKAAAICGSSSIIRSFYSARD